MRTVGASVAAPFAPRFVLVDDVVNVQRCFLDMRGLLQGFGRRAGAQQGPAHRVRGSGAGSGLWLALGCGA
ncbi:hypothetical protein GCM10027610_105200 [Dactylosporangium cerinum]